MSSRALVSAGLRRITPSSAGVRVRLIDGCVSDLTADEWRIIEHASPARQAEFAAGRRCARDALRGLGFDFAVPTIGRGSRGEPLWPARSAGSIAHAGGIAVAAVIRTPGTVTSIGIDLEVADALDRSLWSTVLVPAEEAACAESDCPVERATMHFCAKEALFKAQYPVWGTELDFRDVELEFGQSSSDATVAATVVGSEGHDGAQIRFSRIAIAVTVGAEFVIAAATVRT